MTLLDSYRMLSNQNECPSSNMLTGIPHVIRSALGLWTPSVHSCLVNDFFRADVDARSSMGHHATISARSFVSPWHSNTFVSSWHVSCGNSHCKTVAQPDVFSTHAYPAVCAHRGELLQPGHTCTNFTPVGGVPKSRLVANISTNVRTSCLHVHASDEHALIKANLRNSGLSHVYAGSHQVSAG
jgi:hypothetical protein